MEPENETMYANNYCFSYGLVSVHLHDTSCIMAFREQYKWPLEELQCVA